MNINRHNYETFFLLWVDGELSAQEQEMVERFIDQHPDLAEELALLQETKLPLDETIVFANKESLLRVEQPALSMNSYEAYFLLYIDDELNATDKADVELFVLQHPELQSAFMLLKQTKLAPETIVFPNKALLYRKEEKERPIIYMQWRKIAIAAALIGFIFSLWMIVPNKLNKEVEQAIVANMNTTNKKPGAITKTNDLESKEIKNTNQSEKLIISNASRTDKKQYQLVATNQNTIEQPSTNVLLAQQRIEEGIATTSVETIETTVQTELVSPSNTLLAKAIVTEDEQPTDIIKQAVYRELDTDESSRSLYVGALEFNKDKLRGFFRKAGTIFRSKSKQDDEGIVTNK